MKQCEIREIEEKLSATDLANIFNVYEDSKLGDKNYTYNVNRTMHVTGLQNPDNSLYEEYTAHKGDTWTGISYKYYGTTRLWWLICKMNDIFDPTELPDWGTKVKILKEDYVREILGLIKLG